MKKIIETQQRNFLDSIIGGYKFDKNNTSTFRTAFSLLNLSPSLPNLEAQLKLALQEEDYEKAAELRDRIIMLQKFETL